MDNYDEIMKIKNYNQITMDPNTAGLKTNV